MIKNKLKWTWFCFSITQTWYHSSWWIQMAKSSTSWWHIRSTTTRFTSPMKFKLKKSVMDWSTASNICTPISSTTATYSMKTFSYLLTMLRKYRTSEWRSKKIDNFRRWALNYKLHFTNSTNPNFNTPLYTSHTLNIFVEQFQLYQLHLTLFELHFTNSTILTFCLHFTHSTNSTSQTLPFFLTLFSTLRLYQYEQDDLTATGRVLQKFKDSLHIPSGSFSCLSLGMEYIAINMIRHDSVSRSGEYFHNQITAIEALNSPMFMTVQDSIDFICNISTYFDKNHFYLANTLNKLSFTVIGSTDWTLRNNLNQYYMRCCDFQVNSTKNPDSALTSTTEASTSQSEYSNPNPKIPKKRVKPPRFNSDMTSHVSKTSFASVIKCLRNSLQHPTINSLNAYPDDRKNVVIMKHFLDEIPMIMVAVHQTASNLNLSNISSRVPYRKMWDLPHFTPQPSP